MIRLQKTESEILAWVRGSHPEAEAVLDHIEKQIPRKARREIERFQAAALYKLVFNTMPARILEIGTARGYSAAVMAAAAPAAQIITLNPDEEEAATALHNLMALKLAGRVEVVIQESAAFLADYDGEPFDLIFVDGDHKRVREDLPWWDWLNVGGWMIFHDWSPVTSHRACPPVFIAVNEFGDMLGREPDWQIVDNHEVGMAGFRRSDEDDPFALLQTPPEGMIRHAKAVSLLPLHRLRHLWQIARKTDAEGALVCLGAGPGGAAAVLAKGLLREMDEPELEAWLFDTFAGIPEPTLEDGEKAAEKYAAKDGKWLVFEADAARDAFEEIAGVKPHMVVGLVQDTLPGLREEIGPISILHLDMDWYEPTLVSLGLLYDQIVSGGVVIVDDYGHWPGARNAVDQFRLQRGITAPLVQTDYAQVWWRK